MHTAAKLQHLISKLSVFAQTDKHTV